jgi:ADP-ribosylglycohydrolase
MRDRHSPVITGDSPAHGVLRRYPFSTDLVWDPVTTLVPDREELRDVYRGCLVWAAVGDALGRPAESRDPATLKRRFGPGGIRDYVPWRGWRSGPTGTFTDDTQLTMATAQSLLATGGRLDAEDLSGRFLTIDHIRGIGSATRQALDALRNGVPWWEAGLEANSAGNGAAMRAAPVGLVHAFGPNPAGLVRDAILSAVPTHPHPVGVGGAVVLAAGVAWCVRARLSGLAKFDAPRFVDFVCSTIDDMEPGPTPERKPPHREVKLVERIRELPEMLSRRSTEEVFAHTYNGAFALESVPAALYAFLRSPDEPRQVILTAVNAGYDADTVASMAGNLAGAWNGAQALHSAPSWLSELEARDELIGLADELLDVAIHTRSR